METSGNNPSTEGKWQPRSVCAWVLTGAACVLAVSIAGLGHCMAHPVRWDGAGKFGAMALFFPLHLLVFTAAAGALAFVAKRFQARLAAWMFGLVAVLTALMVLTPTIVIWQQ